MSETIVNQIIRLAAEKPEYRSRLVEFLKKTAVQSNPQELSKMILYRALPALHFKNVPKDLKPSPGLLREVQQFSRDVRETVNTYWIQNSKDFRTPRLPQEMFSDKSIMNIFMLCLEMNPLNWLRANEPRWYRSLFINEEGLEDFIRFLKNNQTLRQYVTDVGGGSIVKNILRAAYKTGAR
ncbi:MAG: hypothetical protein GF334_11625 [Candidatus Altiarchaeales archaeon]|nr:hypothetical protein [Candidatus Altiarchaeales archaeon]